MIEGVLDTGCHFGGQAVLIHHDVQRQVEVRRRALAQTHGDGLVAEVEALCVEGHELLEEGAHRLLRAIGCPRGPLRLAARLRLLALHQVRRELEVLKRRQERALARHANLEEVDGQQGPRVGGQVPLGSVANAAVLGPALDEQDQGLGARLHVSALREQGSVVQGRGAVDGEVDGDGLAVDAERGGHEQRDLRLLAAERGAAELEVAAGDEAVRAGADGRLLQLLHVELGRASSAVAALQASGQNLWRGADDNVHLGHGHTEGGAAQEVAAREARDLDLGHNVAQVLLHEVGQLPHDLVALGGRRNLLHQLVHLRVPGAGAQAQRRDRLGAGLAELGPGGRRRRRHLLLLLLLRPCRRRAGGRTARGGRERSLAAGRKLARRGGHPLDQRIGDSANEREGNLRELERSGDDQQGDREEDKCLVVHLALWRELLGELAHVGTDHVNASHDVGVDDDGCKLPDGGCEIVVLLCEKVFSKEHDQMWKA
mmetsp:Transcript_87742/g.226125  ORF Transcript_87742/g.226125 Transcript_87742/m.226125 type:complete len:486 (-) Transcript_87742:12-1469(-)